jgi:hypothetical protein
MGAPIILSRLSFAVSAWERVYATNLSRLQRETSKRHMGVAQCVLITGIILPQRLSCYWGKTVSLRMLNHKLADLRLTIAQQRSTGQSLPCDLSILYNNAPSISCYGRRILEVPLERDSLYVEVIAVSYGRTWRLLFCLSCWSTKDEGLMDHSNVKSKAIPVTGLGIL